MKTTKRKILNIIRENYSKHDLDLLKKLNQPKTDLELTDSIKKEFINFVEVSSDYKQALFLPYLVKYSNNNYQDTNIGRFYGFDIDNFDYKEVAEMQNREVKYIIKDVFDSISDESLLNLIKELENKDMLSFGLMKSLRTPSDFFDTTQKTTKDYKNNFGWVLHQTRTFDSMIDIVVNGFKYGSRYEDLIYGGKEGDKENGAYTFGYPIDDYENHDIQYGTFFILLKTNFVRSYHKKDDEQQAIFDTHKTQALFPIVYDREFYYVIGHDGRILYKSDVLKTISQWLDTNGRQYSKLLNFRGHNIEEYKASTMDIIMGTAEPKHSGHEKYEKIRKQFKDKQTGKTSFM